MDKLDIEFLEKTVGTQNIKKRGQTDIACYCPICGDDKKRRKARLHLYQVKDYALLNCFNAGCGVQNKTMFSFLKTWFPAELPKYKNARFYQNLKPKSLTHIQQTQEAQDYDFKPEKSQKVLEFLEKRGFTSQDIGFLEKTFKFQFLYSKSSITVNRKQYLTKNSIFIPIDNGFYTRNLEHKIFSIFTKNGNKVFGFNRLDLSKEVYIFEGLFDMFAFSVLTKETNCIALLGVTIPPDVLEKIKTPVLCLDNDYAGISSALKIGSKNPLKTKIYVYEYQEKDFNDYLLNSKIPNLENVKPYLYAKSVLKPRPKGVSKKEKLKNLKKMLTPDFFMV